MHGKEEMVLKFPFYSKINLDFFLLVMGVLDGKGFL